MNKRILLIIVILISLAGFVRAECARCTANDPVAYYWGSGLQQNVDIWNTEVLDVFGVCYNVDGQPMRDLFSNTNLFSDSQGWVAPQCESVEGTCEVPEGVTCDTLGTPANNYNLGIPCGECVPPPPPSPPPEPKQKKASPVTVSYPLPIGRPSIIICPKGTTSSILKEEFKTAECLNYDMVPHVDYPGNSCCIPEGCKKGGVITDVNMAVSGGNFILSEFTIFSPPGQPIRLPQTTLSLTADPIRIETYHLIVYKDNEITSEPVCNIILEDDGVTETKEFIMPGISECPLTDWTEMLKVNNKGYIPIAAVGVYYSEFGLSGGVLDKTKGCPPVIHEPSETVCPKVNIGPTSFKTGERFCLKTWGKLFNISVQPFKIFQKKGDVTSFTRVGGLIYKGSAGAGVACDVNGFIRGTQIPSDPRTFLLGRTRVTQCTETVCPPDKSWKDILKDSGSIAAVRFVNPPWDYTAKIVAGDPSVWPEGPPPDVEKEVITTYCGEYEPPKELPPIKDFKLKYGEDSFNFINAKFDKGKGYAVYETDEDIGAIKEDSYKFVYHPFKVDKGWFNKLKKTLDNIQKTEDDLKNIIEKLKNDPRNIDLKKKLREILGKLKEYRIQYEEIKNSLTKEDLFYMTDGEAIEYNDFSTKYTIERLDELRDDLVKKRDELQAKLDSYEENIELMKSDFYKEIIKLQNEIKNIDDQILKIDGQKEVLNANNDFFNNKISTKGIINFDQHMLDIFYNNILANINYGLSVLDTDIQSTEATISNIENLEIVNTKDLESLANKNTGPLKEFLNELLSKPKRTASDEKLISFLRERIAELDIRFEMSAAIENAERTGDKTELNDLKAKIRKNEGGYLSYEQIDGFIKSMDESIKYLDVKDIAYKKSIIDKQKRVSLSRLNNLASYYNGAPERIEVDKLINDLKNLDEEKRDGQVTSSDINNFQERIRDLYNDGTITEDFRDTAFDFLDELMKHSDSYNDLNDIIQGVDPEEFPGLQEQLRNYAVEFEIQYKITDHDQKGLFALHDDVQDPDMSNRIDEAILYLQNVEKYYQEHPEERENLLASVVSGLLDYAAPDFVEGINGILDQASKAGISKYQLLDERFKQEDEKIEKLEITKAMVEAELERLQSKRDAMGWWPFKTEIDNEIEITKKQLRAIKDNIDKDRKDKQNIAMKLFPIPGAKDFENRAYHIVDNLGKDTIEAKRKLDDLELEWITYAQKWMEKNDYIYDGPVYSLVHKNKNGDMLSYDRDELSYLATHGIDDYLEFHGISYWERFSPTTDYVYNHGDEVIKVALVGAVAALTSEVSAPILGLGALGKLALGAFYFYNINGIVDMQLNGKLPRFFNGEYTWEMTPGEAVVSYAKGYFHTLGMFGSLGALGSLERSAMEGLLGPEAGLLTKGAFKTAWLGAMEVPSFVIYNGVADDILFGKTTDFSDFRNQYAENLMFLTGLKIGSVPGRIADYFERSYIIKAKTAEIKSAEENYKQANRMVEEIAEKAESIQTAKPEIRESLVNEYINALNTRVQAKENYYNKIISENRVSSEIYDSIQKDIAYEKAYIEKTKADFVVIRYREQGLFESIPTDIAEGWLMYQRDYSAKAGELSEDNIMSRLRDLQSRRDAGKITEEFYQEGYMGLMLEFDLIRAKENWAYSITEIGYKLMDIQKFGETPELRDAFNKAKFDGDISKLDYFTAEKAFAEYHVSELRAQEADLRARSQLSAEESLELAELRTDIAELEQGLERLNDVIDSTNALVKIETDATTGEIIYVPGPLYDLYSTAMDNYQLLKEGQILRSQYERSILEYYDSREEQLKKEFEKGMVSADQATEIETEMYEEISDLIEGAKELEDATISSLREWAYEEVGGEDQSLPVKQILRRLFEGEDPTLTSIEKLPPITDVKYTMQFYAEDSEYYKQLDRLSKRITNLKYAMVESLFPVTNSIIVMQGDNAPESRDDIVDNNMFNPNTAGKALADLNSQLEEATSNVFDEKHVTTIEAIAEFFPHRTKSFYAFTTQGDNLIPNYIQTIGGEAAEVHFGDTSVMQQLIDQNAKIDVVYAIGEYVSPEMLTDINKLQETGIGVVVLTYDSSDTVLAFDDYEAAGFTVIAGGKHGTFFNPLYTVVLEKSGEVVERPITPLSATFDTVIGWGGGLSYWIIDSDPDNLEITFGLAGQPDSFYIKVKITDVGHYQILETSPGINTAHIISELNNQKIYEVPPAVPSVAEIGREAFGLTAGPATTEKAQNTIAALQAGKDALAAQNQHGALGDLAGKKIPDIVQDTMLRDSNIVYLPKTGTLIIVGDTHGDFNSLAAAADKFLQLKREGREAYLVLTGDYVDRGHNSIEDILFLLKLVEEFPDSIVMLKGNHEYDPGGLMNLHALYGLQQELIDKFGDHWELVYAQLMEVFDNLPLITVTGNGVVIAHGGIPQGVTSLADMQAMTHDQIIELLWNDPGTEPGFVDSIRGEGIYLFGQDVFNNFMDNIGGTFFVRSHEYKDPDGNILTDGYYVNFDGKLITTFSTEYERGIDPAYIQIDLSADTVTTDDIYNHPDIPDLVSDITSQIVPPNVEQRTAILGELAEEWPSLVGVIPGLTPELESDFRFGRKVTLIGDQLVVGGTLNGGETISYKPADQNMLEAYERWKRAEGMGEYSTTEDVKDKLEELKSFLNQYGIELRYEDRDIDFAHPNDKYDLAMGPIYEIILDNLRQLPESHLRSDKFKILNLKGSPVRVDMAKLYGGTYNDETGEIRIYEFFFDGARRSFIGILSHELGHPVYDALSPEIKDELSRNFNIIVNNNGFLGTHFWGTPGSRVEYVSRHISEGFAEFYMIYLHYGNGLRNFINNLPASELKTAYTNFYNLFKNEVFEGKEFINYIDGGFVLLQGDTSVALTSPGMFDRVRVKVDGKGTLPISKGQFDMEEGDVISIGRKPDNDVSILHKSISKYHAKLEIRNGRIYITDLESANGVYVNGVRITSNQEIEVTTDDKIMLADPGPGGIEIDLGGIRSFEFGGVTYAEYGVVENVMYFDFVNMRQNYPEIRQALEAIGITSEAQVVDMMYLHEFYHNLINELGLDVGGKANEELIVSALAKQKIGATLNMAEQAALQHLQQNILPGLAQQLPDLSSDAIQAIEDMFNYPALQNIGQVDDTIGDFLLQVNALEQTISQELGKETELGLNNIQGADLTPEFIEQIRDRNTIGEVDVVGDAIERFNTDPNPVNRIAALDQLVEHQDDQRAMDFIVSALTDESADVRVVAIQHIISSGYSRAMDELVATLQDSDILVQYYAQRALILLGRADLAANGRFNFVGDFVEMPSDPQIALELMQRLGPRIVGIVTPTGEARFFVEPLLDGEPHVDIFEGVRETLAAETGQNPELYIGSRLAWVEGRLVFGGDIELGPKISENPDAYNTLGRGLRQTFPLPIEIVDYEYNQLFAEEAPVILNTFRAEGYDFYELNPERIYDFIEQEGDQRFLTTIDDEGNIKVFALGSLTEGPSYLSVWYAVTEAYPNIVDDARMAWAENQMSFLNIRADDSNTESQNIISMAEKIQSLDPDISIEIATVEGSFSMDEFKGAFEAKLPVEIYAAPKTIEIFPKINPYIAAGEMDIVGYNDILREWDPYSEYIYNDIDWIKGSEGIIDPIVAERGFPKGFATLNDFFNLNARIGNELEMLDFTDYDSSKVRMVGSSVTEKEFRPDSDYDISVIVNQEQYNSLVDSLESRLFEEKDIERFKQTRTYKSFVKERNKGKVSKYWLNKLSVNNQFSEDIKNFQFELERDIDFSFVLEGSPFDSPTFLPMGT